MTPTPYTNALAALRAPLGDERPEVEALALRLATDRSGAFFGDTARLAQLACELGAEYEGLRAKVEAFLGEWDRPYTPMSGWVADLKTAVQALRGDA